MGDWLRGMLLVIFIVGLAGAIAYIGDRVGHQVGRKRLSLFGIRPRYTSTIVAIGTGMLIALIVVVGALIASNSVKTAFFHLNAINARVAELQAQASELERHTRNEQVIVGVGELMTPEYITLPMNDPTDKRMTAVRAYFNRVAAFVNATYVPRGLKSFNPSPAEVDRRIRDYAGAVELTSALSQSPVVIIATADHNLFNNDPIHFEFQTIRDVLVFPAGSPVASFVLPASPAINVQFVLAQLQQLVTQSALRNGMQPFSFAQNVRVSGPSLAALQAQLRGRGQFRIMARAATNVYPHIAQVPVTVSISRQ